MSQPGAVGSYDDSIIAPFSQRYVNLASEELGAVAVAASDEFFGAKERMLRDAEPIFLPDEYDTHGKWMDGWETRRRRDGGHDYCDIRLAMPGRIFGVEIDTSFFTGNYPPFVSLEAVKTGGGPPPESGRTTLIEHRAISGDSKTSVIISDPSIYDMVRLNIFPDGGIARLKVFGRPTLDLAAVGANQVIELSAIDVGGCIIGYSDSHYSSPSRLLLPGRGINMGDGWETRRRRDGGFDWIVIALGAPGLVSSVEVDTDHFKGNYPDRCSIQAAFFRNASDAEIISSAGSWPMLMAEQKLQADSQHSYSAELDQQVGAVSHIRLNSIPDGGISRVRVFGALASDA